MYSYIEDGNRFREACRHRKTYSELVESGAADTIEAADAIARALGWTLEVVDRDRHAPIGSSLWERLKSISPMYKYGFELILLIKR